MKPGGEHCEASALSFDGPLWAGCPGKLYEQSGGPISCNSQRSQTDWLNVARCAQDEQITAYYSSAPQYTMNSREENIVRLLRTALRDIHEQDAGASYMRRIRDLDPPNMMTLDQQGQPWRNSFFDICCKVCLSPQKITQLSQA